MLEPAREWQGIVDYSAQMLQRAEAGEWEALALMAQERHQRLEGFFSIAVDEQMADEVSQGILQLGEVDAAITQLAQRARKELNQDSGLLQRRRQASRAYSDSSHNLR